MNANIPPRLVMAAPHAALMANTADVASVTLIADHYTAVAGQPVPDITILRSELPPGHAQEPVLEDIGRGAYVDYYDFTAGRQSRGQTSADLQEMRHNGSRIVELSVRPESWRQGTPNIEDELLLRVAAHAKNLGRLPETAEPRRRGLLAALAMRGAEDSKPTLTQDEILSLLKSGLRPFIVSYKPGSPARGRLA